MERETSAQGGEPGGGGAWLDQVPIVDGHLHAPLRLPRPHDEPELLSLFTESRAPAQLPHVAHTLCFQQALPALAALHDCAPAVAALLAARATLTPQELFARCVGRAGVRALLVDDGYRRPDSYTLDELREFVPLDCQVAAVLRIETVVEALAAEHADFQAVEMAFALALHDLRARGHVALKSILAYRRGLALGPPDRTAAAAAWPALHAQARRGGLRLTEPSVLDYFLCLAAALAREQGLPLQLHTGLGDSDLDLLQANPLLLRPAIEAGVFRDVPLVLLHTYPYVREAGYLASLYPEVYLDLSLAIPLVGPAGQRVLGEALELAPASKVLYGSDAAGLAESIWLGARAVRTALAGALADWVRGGALSAAQAEAVAERILWRNAAALYGLALT